MSSNGDGNGDRDDNQGGAGRREVAWRVFAAEYDDSDFDYSESDEERAPNYVVTPTGARINRLFVVGVLTEVEQVSDDVLRARVVDPTGAFVLYAGQYQPDEMAFLENASPPAFVAVTGKARTFQPEDSDRVFTSIRPESINRVDADTRDRWVVQTAEQTLSRVSTFADALDSGERGDPLREALEANGVDSGLAAGIPLALDHYGTTRAYLADVWDLAVDSARVVAGEIDADDVGPLELAPDEGGDEVGVDLDYSLTDAEAGDLSDLETGASAPEGSVATESPESAGAADATETAESPEATETAEATESTEATETAAPTESTDTESGLGDAPESTATADEDLGDAPEPGTETTEETETTADDGLGDAPTGTVEDAEDAAELQDEIGTDDPPTVESEQDTSTDEEFAPETDGDDEGPDIGTAGAGDEMYEFDDEEREQVEEEYGLEFSSGSEVESPGESEMDAPSPDPERGPDEPTTERETELDDDEPNAGEPADPTAEEVDTDELQDVESASGGTEEVVNTDDEAPAGGASAAAEAPGASIAENEIADEGDEGEAADSDEEAGGEEAEAPANLEDTVMDQMRELNDGDGVERETLLAAVVQDYDVTPADVEDALEAALMAGRCYESGEETLKPI
ncbi:hypothetical protein M0R89_00060 [Halorussus limi]|uniref:Rpa-associated protein n=1 Tax=Halorussus limi TaxID=2938695 RepID=A0A8U0HTY7_9EURY|nr:hypothetical protein [Halorussus limi]UPV74480.1 hypothetical protein M0R89_00060 [Halorussus limi]